MIYFDDMIDIKTFEPNLLNIDKKSHRYIDIYYIGYITIKKFNTYKNINSVYPLYLIIHSATGYFIQEHNEMYLILDLIEKYEKVFSGIKSEIATINNEEKMYYKKIIQ